MRTIVQMESPTVDDCANELVQTNVDDSANAVGRNWWCRNRNWKNMEACL